LNDLLALLVFGARISQALIAALNLVGQIPGLLNATMTNLEYTKRILEVARRNHCEDGFSTRMLKQQIASMEREPKSAEAMFLIGGEG
jgi:hypothetical protein